MKPVIPIAVEEGFAIRPEAGVMRREAQWIVSEEDASRLRQGYACLQCGEGFASAYPDKCVVCGYNVRKNQAEDFAMMHEGEERIGSSMSLSDELARMDEENERTRRLKEQGLWLPS